MTAATGLPKGLRLIDLNSNANNGIRRFEIEAVAPARNKPYFSIKHEASLNPTDWALEAFRVNIFGIDDYSALISSVSSTSVVQLTTGRPVSSGSVQANLVTAKFDVLGILADTIIDASMEAAGFDPAAAKPDPNEIRLPNAPGVYVVQAYSGALYHGLGDQYHILDENDPRHRWLAMLGINSFIIAVDTVSVLVPFPKDGAKLGGVLNGLLFSIEKLLASRQGTGTLEENTALLRAMTKSIAKALLKGLVGDVGDLKFSKILKGVGKTVGKVFDITGKVSKVGQAIERRSGLTSSSSLAIERSIVVVGDPWGPVIERFSPLSAES